MYGERLSISARLGTELFKKEEYLEQMCCCHMWKSSIICFRTGSHIDDFNTSAEYFGRRLHFRFIHFLQFIVSLLCQLILFLVFNTCLNINSPALAEENLLMSITNKAITSFRI